MEMPSTLNEWADIAIIIGLGYAILQFQLGKKQMSADYERSRREKSVELLMEWSKLLKRENSAARKIIDTLSEEQCRKILQQQKVRVSKEHKELLFELLYSESSKLTAVELDGGLVEGDDYFELSESDSSKLRWAAVNYLNALEFVLVAWQYSIVDRDIIEHQFSYLFKPADGYELMKHFRKAAGGEETFPAIEIFTEHLNNKRRESLQSKANIA
ncbi:hypothetical protein [Neisseria subflava]|jgi:hypothetical protein|uniref:hypothetical protein n=1 Tax=Neisseria subflava TaxID=28449 RepID=UPI00280B2D13|nr:hypothetical protein [Neisseria subflava]